VSPCPEVTNEVSPDAARARALEAAKRSGDVIDLVAWAYSVHFSAQRKQLYGMRWVPSLDRWVITRHKLDTKRLADQND
jgi:hypothetical protein